MNSFKIIIPNTKEATYKVVTFIIGLMNIFALMYVRIKSNLIFHQNISLIGSALMLSIFVFYLLSTSPKGKMIMWVGFLACGIFWGSLGFYSVAFLMLLFAFFGFITSKKIEIVIDANGIKYPSFPSKKIAWNEINQVLVKDGVLTIDLENNKLIQFTLSRESADQIKESDFNKNCIDFKNNYTGL